LMCVSVEGYEQKQPKQCVLPVWVFRFATCIPALCTFYRKNNCAENKDQSLIKVCILVVYSIYALYSEKIRQTQENLKGRITYLNTQENLRSYRLFKYFQFSVVTVVASMKSSVFKIRK
jgi:hypothetical protein